MRISSIIFALCGATAASDRRRGNLHSHETSHGENNYSRALPSCPLHPCISTRLYFSFCQPDKKEEHYTHINLATSTGDHQYIKANSKFFAVATRAGGGGALAVIPHKSCNRQDDRGLRIEIPDEVMEQINDLKRRLETLQVPSEAQKTQSSHRGTDYMYVLGGF